MADRADPGSANESAEKEPLPAAEVRRAGSEPAGSSPPDHGYLSFDERGRRAAAERKARGLEPKPSAGSRETPAARMRTFRGARSP